MKERRGEKIGWLGGWLGSFLWWFLLSAMWLYQGKYGWAALGLALFAAAVVLIFSLAPWKHPETLYRSLMAPILGVLLMAVGLALCLETRYNHPDVRWWSFLWLLPLLIPLASIGKRRWKDGDA